MVSHPQQQRVLAYIDIGDHEGARIAAQAPLPGQSELTNGFFVPPTLFVDVDADMRIAKEEIFGPVVAVIPFDDEAEAISIANGTDYGLTASIYSADVTRAIRVSRDIDGGVITINNYSRGGVGTPFGGTRHSGYGREHSPETLREYGQSKSLRLPTGTGDIPRWAAVTDVLNAHSMR